MPKNRNFFFVFFLFFFFFFLILFKNGALFLFCLWSFHCSFEDVFATIRWYAGERTSRSTYAVHDVQGLKNKLMLVICPWPWTLAAITSVKGAASKWQPLKSDYLCTWTIVCVVFLSLFCFLFLFLFLFFVFVLSLFLFFVDYIVNPLREIRLTLPGYSYIRLRVAIPIATTVCSIFFSKLWYGCQCLGVWLCAQISIHAVVHSGCTNTVKIRAERWLRSLCVCVCGGGGEG